MCGIGEILRGHVRLIGGDIGIDQARLIATGGGMEKIHQVPTIVFRELVHKRRHAGTGDAVGQPVEKIPRSVLGRVRLCEEIDWWDREGLS